MVLRTVWARLIEKSEANCTSLGMCLETTGLKRSESVQIAGWEAGIGTDWGDVTRTLLNRRSNNGRGGETVDRTRTGLTFKGKIASGLVGGHEPIKKHILPWVNKGAGEWQPSLIGKEKNSMDLCIKSQRKRGVAEGEGTVQDVHEESTQKNRGRRAKWKRGRSEGISVRGTGVDRGLTE